MIVLLVILLFSALSFFLNLLLLKRVNLVKLDRRVQMPKHVSFCNLETNLEELDLSAKKVLVVGPLCSERYDFAIRLIGLTGSNGHKRITAESDTIEYDNEDNIIVDNFNECSLNMQRTTIAKVVKSKSNGVVIICASRIESVPMDWRFDYIFISPDSNAFKKQNLIEKRLGMTLPDVKSPSPDSFMLVNTTVDASNSVSFVMNNI